MFLDVMDAGGTVGIEQESEHLAYPIGKHLAFLYIMGAFSADIELVFLTTRTDFEQVAFSLHLHPGHFPVKNLRQTPQ